MMYQPTWNESRKRIGMRVLASISQSFQVPIGSTKRKIFISSSLPSPPPNSTTTTTTITSIVRTTKISNDRSKNTYKSHQPSRSFQQSHHCYKNVMVLLLPLLIMMLNETSALPPIIKIGKFVHVWCNVVRYIDCWGFPERYLCVCVYLKFMLNIKCKSFSWQVSQYVHAKFFGLQ